MKKTILLAAGAVLLAAAVSAFVYVKNETVFPHVWDYGERVRCLTGR